MAADNPEWGFDTSLLIKAPAAAVWAHVADPSRMSRWWCPPPTVTITFEPHVGARYAERYRDDSYEYAVDGEIKWFEEPRSLTIKRRIAGRFGSSDCVGITLRARGDRTSVTISHTFENLLAERRGEARDFFADGWAYSLELLRRNVLDTD